MSTGALRLVALAAWIASATAAGAVQAGEVRRHVLVVGVNTSVDESVQPLSYADDDAARYAEAFAGAASLRVLSVMDAETQGLFPDTAAEALPPSTDVFFRAVDGAFADVRADVDAGKDADFVLVLVGHGGVDAGTGEGYVSLLDGKLTRTALLERVIARSPARFNHIIVDACDAYAVLYRDAAAVAAVRELVEARSLAHYPNTGVLLATSSARETHEWSRVRGGVFSHEVLAALSGAADVDGDGRVSYPEMGAFIEAANAGVKDARAHVDFTLRAPPLFLARPLSALPKARRSLAFARKDAGHFAIEDARGVTVVEVNKSAEQPLVVALAGAPPFRVIRGSDEWIADVDGRATFAALPRATGERIAARSAVADALDAGLFTVPFGKSYVAGYAAALSRSGGPPVAATATSAERGGDAWAGVGVVSAGALLVAGGVVAGGVALSAVSDLDDGKGKLNAFQAQGLADKANSAVVIAAVLAGAGVAVGGVGAFLWASSSSP